MPSKVFEVRVEYVIYVSADDEAEAGRWVEGNVTEWASDPIDNSSIAQLNALDMKRLSEGVLTALPWRANGCPDSELRSTVADLIKEIPDPCPPTSTSA